MFKPNGCTRHKNEVSNFDLTEISIDKVDVTNFNGTLTITPRDSPIIDSVTVIVFSNEIVDVYFDPERIGNHFEN
jgi:hypothetical protein